ncbi:unnamed protein product [Blepharisma stoltei]|uniref:Uncharacterized protein n=1 Tax=Blepharisma stoltei TaxID=1481888 RepID=A0AAU9K9N8_9CILI|nr:unnamed protein product [Blepharisma stoltei]
MASRRPVPFKDEEENPVPRRKAEANLEGQTSPDAKYKTEPIQPITISSSNRSKEYGRWGLYSIKTELALHDIRTSLYWQSLLELGLMILGLLMLLIQGKLMILLHFMHFVRPLLAYKLILSIPQSHKVYEQLPDDLRQVTHEVQVKLFEEFKQSTRPATFYLIASAVAAIFDFLSLFINLGMLGGDDYSTNFFFAVAFLFICTDFFLVVWYFTLQFTYPDDVWRNLMTIAKGTIDEAKFYLDGVFKKAVEA